MTRLEQLMQALPVDVDAALVTSEVNRHYYTGFESSAGTVLAARGKSWLIIDSRYFEAAAKAVGSCEVLLQGNVHDQLNELIGKNGIKRVAVESRNTSLRAFAELEERLQAGLVGDNALSDAINRQRSIKSQGELDAILAAQRISDETFSHILNFIGAGRTEREIALEMEFYSRKNGSEGAAFSFIVVSGANSSLPHGVPTEKKVEQGDFVTMDFGSMVGGYRSDMTRTVAVGHVSEEQRGVYETVLRAQLASLEVIRAGAVCKDVDKAARDIITDRGYGDCFGHGLGHSLGLDIHEDPRFSPVCETVLEAGMVMSVEPGIYLPNKFGVRIEDIVAVTEDGFLNLCGSAKNLLVL